jgi:hypothetical protein
MAVHGPGRGDSVGPLPREGVRAELPDRVPVGERADGVVTDQLSATSSRATTANRYPA